MPSIPTALLRDFHTHCIAAELQPLVGGILTVLAKSTNVNHLKHDKGFGYGSNGYNRASIVAGGLYNT